MLAFMAVLSPRWAVVAVRRPWLNREKSPPPDAALRPARCTSLAALEAAVRT